MVEEEEIKTIIDKLEADGAMDEEIEDEPDYVQGYRKGLYEAVEELEALVD